MPGTKVGNCRVSDKPSSSFLAPPLVPKGSPMRVLFVMCLILQIPLASSTVLAQSDHSGSSEKLGTVHFSTSCSSATEQEFNRAVELMHSFQFARAIESFHAIVASDPSCSMAYWGIALSSWGNPFVPGLKPQAQLDEGLKAVTQARAANPKTARERTFVEAVARLYSDTATDRKSVV